ncbi:hypothetical protein Q31b_47570 [Novipirellula aureliae]|uniref:Uncharacterized protein n=1 Tax=Novipirellula aureliae TaxID=2527966 RepID=A0A5C6DNE6_9BACT|nr:hypothetical protein Q31b_47570 [Novipirellula aureliae]
MNTVNSKIDNSYFKYLTELPPSSPSRDGKLMAHDLE